MLPRCSGGVIFFRRMPWLDRYAILDGVRWMKTLLEIFDERPMENVLATDTFRPETTVFLCADAVAADRTLHESYRRYFLRRGLNTKVVFVKTDLMAVGPVINSLRRLTSEYEDCALDITGGSDAVLFACGLFCAEEPLPVFTFSRRSSRFYNIRNAGFVDRQPTVLTYSVSDVFLMAGAEIQEGRDQADNLREHMDQFPGFYNICDDFRRGWTDAVSYFQQISAPDKYGNYTMDAGGDWQVKGPQGHRLTADAALLTRLADLGFILDLDIEEGRSVRFRFCDASVRFWLRDVGSFLELYVWDVCRRSGLFNDLRCSTVVNWDGLPPRDAVTNEIDVMAVRGIKPLLLSCKACPVKTEAVNELAVLRDRFGGQMASAAVVTTYPCKAVTRRRAMELGMDIIDRADLSEGRLQARLKALSSVSQRR